MILFVVWELCSLFPSMSAGGGGGLSQNYGHFDPIEDDEERHCHSAPVEFESNEEPLQKSLSLPTPVTDPPIYVLESSLHSQHLWYETAGTRPRQPLEERMFYEKLWQQNFRESKVEYSDHQSSGANEPKENFVNLKNEFDEDVLFCGKSPHSNAGSKSFMNHRLSSLTVQIPRFKIVRKMGSKADFHGEFLVTVALGSVTHGVWRRHSDFKKLFDKILVLNCRTSFRNSILSWQCVLNRQAWFRCIDKVFLGPDYF